MFRLFLFLAIPLCFFEGLPLYKEKKWKEFITFGILIGISFVLTIGKTFEIPNPVEMLQRILEPVGKAVFKQF